MRLAYVKLQIMIIVTNGGMGHSLAVVALAVRQHSYWPKYMHACEV